MSLLEKLKKDRVEAMKTHYKAKVDLIGVVLGEATKQTKEPSDDQILKVIKNNITTTQEVIETLEMQRVKLNEARAITPWVGQGGGDEYERLDDAKIAATNEINLLTPYLPAEVSVFEIRTLVEERKAAGDDFGKIMKAAKLKWGACVDMKMVTQLAKE